MVANAFSGVGFTPEAPTVFEFPIEMFIPGSDLSPIEENVDKIVFGLTGWKPKAGAERAAPARITVEANDYEGLTRNLNNLLLRDFGGDGLPLLPPTEERVNWILTGTDVPRDTVVGRILPQGRIATIEALAVNLAMAGGRPEYLPVLIAAIEAIVDPAVTHQVFNATTCSTYPALVVNGPVAKDIRLNSGYGCLGPHPRYPAGACIGRAVRLIQLNLGGAMPGVGSMAIFGGASRYTNVVFAEDEDGLPATWDPLNTSYFGFPRGTSTVAVHPVGGSTNINEASVGTPETALMTLHTISRTMSTPNWNYWLSVSGFAPGEGCPGILLLARGTAKGLAQFGWSKKRVKEFLWDASKVPYSVVEGGYYPYRLKASLETHRPYLAANEAWPITSVPENIMIVVAGGQQSGHAYWMQVGTGRKPACKPIRLPGNWQQLLKKADQDLGPRP
ncbi:MAG: hypothetical protein HYY32_02230 [Chloroflexi bacterium]|nr:hypothetical protein [Chloroflexota bacterium]